MPSTVSTRARSPSAPGSSGTPPMGPTRFEADTTATVFRAARHATGRRGRTIRGLLTCFKRDPTARAGYAAVIGGGMAGLLAARALAAHFAEVTVGREGRCRGPGGVRRRRRA